MKKGTLANLRMLYRCAHENSAVTNSESTSDNGHRIQRWVAPHQRLLNP